MNWGLLQNSVLMSGAATGVAVGFGFLLALWAWGLGRSQRLAVQVVAGIAFALPPFLVTNAWLDLLGEAGVLHGWFPFKIYSLAGGCLILALLSWPVTFFLVWGSWGQLERSHLEAEPLLRGRAFVRWLLVPMARPGLATAAMVTFALNLNNFAVPAILQVKVFPAELWVSYSTRLDAGEALMLSWPLVLIPWAVWLWIRRQGTPWPRLDVALEAGSFRDRLGMGTWRACGALSLGVCALSVGAPLLQLLGSGRTWVELPQAVAAGLPALGQSATYAVFTASAVLGLALITWRMPLGSAFWMLFFFPGVLLGVGFILVLNRPPVDVWLRCSAGLVMALIFHYAAPGWNLAAQAMRSSDPDLVDAARLGGLKGWAFWRVVHVPLSGTRFAMAWYVTYVLVLWDVETSVLLIPPGPETLALRVFNLLHYGHASQVNAICLALLILAAAPLALWHVGQRIWGRVAAAPLFGGSGCMAGFGLLLAVGVGAAGCGGTRDKHARIESQLFSGVQVIGVRGTGPGAFNKPRSLAVDSQDNLYVADMTGRVQKFSPEGEFLLAWEMPQTDLGKPKGMDRDGAGRIVVVEPHYARVNHFDGSGKPLLQWGTQGTNSGELAFPRAVAVTSKGELWLSEYSKVERVQRFSADGGRLLGSVGRPGDRPGEFARAEGIGVDARDQLFVADSCNHRIQVFDAAGRFLRSHGRAGQGMGELSYPYDVRIDAAGRQYVCEFGNSRVQVFDEQDRPIEVLGGPGSEVGRLSNPWAIALDSQGNLYVADSMNHRVQKFIRRSATWTASRPKPEPTRAPHGGNG
jgi:ABC-type Fe3+ transport system permease subunit/DNA-binding beta-propeller fold protein YncE